MEDISQLNLFRKSQQEIFISDTYHHDAKVTLYLGDRLELLDQIKETGDKANLIITSPPYNTGKEYETVKSLDEYVEDQQKTIKACLEVLAPTGSICWQVGHYIQGAGRDKEAYPLDLILYPVFKRYGLKLRNRIVWTFGHGLNENFRFTGRHETILWFTWDTTEYTFNLDPIRVPQKYPGKRAYQGPKAGQLSGNPMGKNPSDVWDMPNVKSNHPEKTEHPCQFPVGLVERFVLSTTNLGDLVVDPYLGVGSTAIAASLNGRRSAGADLEKKYLDIARERLELARTGLLRLRDRDKPVYEPDPNNKLARIPDEWKNGNADQE